MAEEEFTREQELLKRLRDERCDGNAAELARRLKKDPTYVNRLLYPIGKKGRKGIGLEVMRAATEAFKLPAGYWEGAEDRAQAAEPTGEVFEKLTLEEDAMLYDYRRLLDKDRKEFHAQITKKAEERQAEMDELFAKYGVVRAAERANARRPQTTRAEVEPGDHLKQRDLPLDGGTKDE